MVILVSLAVLQLAYVIQNYLFICFSRVLIHVHDLRDDSVSCIYI